MTGFGPIFLLQVKGMVCPCLLKSEDANARQAVKDINGACRRVQMHPLADRSSNSNDSKSRGFSLGSLFGSRADSGEATTTVPSQPPPTRGTNYLAKLVVHDSGGDGQPEFLVIPIGNYEVEVEQDNEEGMQCNASKPQQQKQRTGSPEKKKIKLRRVDKVRLEGDQIVLTSKKGSSGSPARELLRFTVLQPLCTTDNNQDFETNVSQSSSTEILPVTPDTRNTLVHHFMVLTEWERQRRAALHVSDPDNYNNDSEDEEEEEQHHTNFFTARAQKAAHFAKRELELQKTKKEREQRKAKLISEAGGLKYTAMAMANMQS